MPEAIIRPARVEDDGFIRALAGRAGLRLDPAAERGREHAILLVAVSDRAEPLGFILGWQVADELEILDVAVDEGVRRLGIGRILLHQLLALGRRKGAGEAFLEVRATNDSAQRLYQSTGFQESGRRARYYSDGEDALIFRCCLTPGQ